MKPLVRNLLIGGAVALGLLVGALLLVLLRPEPPRDIPLGEFESTLADGQVHDAKMMSSDDVVTGDAPRRHRVHGDLPR